jgi:hypothetical protein
MSFICWPSCCTRRSARRTAGILWCSRSWFRLAPIVALRRARGSGVKVAAPDDGRGARSARNLDAAEHARTLVGRSERSHHAAATNHVPSLQLARSGRTFISTKAKYREGGATSPQGTNVDQTWVDDFDRRGRRSPLVSRSGGRPRANAEQGRSCWRNCKWLGTPRGAWGGTSPILDVVPSVCPFSDSGRDLATTGHAKGERRRYRSRHPQGVGARLSAAGGVAPPRALARWVARR